MLGKVSLGFGWGGDKAKSCLEKINIFSVGHFLEYGTFSDGMLSNGTLSDWDV